MRLPGPHRALAMAAVSSCALSPNEVEIEGTGRQPKRGHGGEDSGTWRKEEDAFGGGAGTRIGFRKRKTNQINFKEVEKWKQKRKF